MPPLYRVTNAETANTVFYRRLKSRSIEGLRPAQAVSALGARRGVTGPGPSTTTSSARYIQGLIDQKLFMDVTGQNVAFTAGFIGTDIARNAITSAPAATAESLALFIQAMANSASRKQGLARIHENIAREAQQAVITEYEGRFGGGGQYRAGQNRLSGRMSPTLRRSDLILASRDGIFYMNRAALDQGAAHWYRLNFGAQPAARGRRPGSFPLKFDGQVAGALTLRGNRASGRFRLPRGIWLAGNRPVAHDRSAARSEGVRGRTGDQFYTVKWFYQRAFALRGDAASDFKDRLVEFGTNERRRIRRNPGRVPFKDSVETEGIRGAQFFDAGVKVIAHQMPLQYSSLLLTWQKESAQSGTGPVAKVLARPQ